MLHLCLVTPYVCPKKSARSGIGRLAILTELLQKKANESQLSSHGLSIKTSKSSNLLHTDLSSLRVSARSPLVQQDLQDPHLRRLSRVPGGCSEIAPKRKNGLLGESQETQLGSRRGLRPDLQSSMSPPNPGSEALAKLSAAGCHGARPPRQAVPHRRGKPPHRQRGGEVDLGRMEGFMDATSEMNLLV